MTTDQTMSGTHPSEAVSRISTDEATSFSTTMGDDGSTTMMTNLSYSSNDTVTETLTEGTTIDITTNAPGVTGFVTPVIVFSVIILLLAIVIFGIRSSKRRKRQQIIRVKQKEDETAMTAADPCKESIYLDVMPSATIEEDDLQEERETPYVILEFQSSNANEGTPVESPHSIDSSAEDPGTPLESQETRL